MHTGLKMTTVGLALTLVGGCSQVRPALPLPYLGVYQGDKRVLIIDTPATDTPAYLATMQGLAAEPAGLLERDCIIITQTMAPAFQVRLVGKDGGVKYSSKEALTAAQLFALIDAMPMRRAEQARQAAGK